MKKDDGEDIDINPRKNDKVYFESAFIQNISDSIDYFKEETTEILRELDSEEFRQKIDVMDLEEFSEEAINNISEVFDEFSQFKDQVINHDELPEEVREFSRNTKAYLNRDEVYIRKAKRKLKNSNSYKVSARVIELCDKAIELDGENPEPHYLKGQAFINLKNYDDAVDEFITALAIDENYINARMGIADVNRMKGEFEDALDVYDSVLSISRASSEALKGKAVTYFAMEEYRTADEFFIKSNAIKTVDDKSQEIWDLCRERM